MPTTSSAKKRLRQAVKRTVRNRAARSEVRNVVRNVRRAIAAGDAAKSETDLRVAYKKLDQAAAHGIIHKNAAARTKSRLSAAIKSLKTASAGQ